MALITMINFYGVKSLFRILGTHCKCLICQIWSRYNFVLIMKESLQPGSLCPHPLFPHTYTFCFAFFPKRIRRLRFTKLMAPFYFFLPICFGQDYVTKCWIILHEMNTLYNWYSILNLCKMEALSESQLRTHTDIG